MSPSRIEINILGSDRGLFTDRARSLSPTLRGQAEIGAITEGARSSDGRHLTSKISPKTIISQGEQLNLVMGFTLFELTTTTRMLLQKIGRAHV